jgi:predicted nucleotidyltransferase
MPLFTPEEREETAERVSRALGDDSRVEGVVVVGSLAGQADRWSDIDLAVVVGDEDLAAVTADWVGYLYELLPVVHYARRSEGYEERRQTEDAQGHNLPYSGAK